MLGNLISAPQIREDIQEVVVPEGIGQQRMKGYFRGGHIVQRHRRVKNLAHWGELQVVAYGYKYLSVTIHVCVEQFIWCFQFYQHDIFT